MVLCLLFIRHSLSKDFNHFTHYCLLNLRHAMVTPMYVATPVDSITWCAAMGCVTICFFYLYIQKNYCSILFSLI